MKFPNDLCEPGTRTPEEIAELTEQLEKVFGKLVFPPRP